MHTLSTIRFRFEPDAVGGGGGGAETIFDEPAPAPAPAAPAFEQPAPAPAAPVDPAAAPAAPEVPAWDAERAQQFDQLLEFAQNMQGLLSQAQQEEQYAMQQAEAERAAEAARTGQPQWDPIEPDRVNEYVSHVAGQVVAQQLQEQLAPVMQYLEQLQPFALSAAEQQGERVAEQEFQILTQEIGDFDQDMALRMAVFLQGEGFSGRDALRAGAIEAQRIEAEIRDRAQADVTGRQAELARLNGEPAATGPHGAEGDIELPQGRLAYREAARASLARLRPVPPQ